MVQPACVLIVDDDVQIRELLHSVVLVGNVINATD